MAVKTIEDRVKALELNLRNLNVFVVKYKSIIEALNASHPALPVDGRGDIEVPDKSATPIVPPPQHSAPPAKTSGDGMAREIPVTGAKKAKPAF